MGQGGTMADDEGEDREGGDDEGEPEVRFYPGIAPRAANPELRRKVEERIRERERRRGDDGDADGRDEAEAQA